MQGLVLTDQIRIRERFSPSIIRLKIANPARPTLPRLPQTTRRQRRERDSPHP